MSKQPVPARKPDGTPGAGLPALRHDGEFVEMQDLLPVITSFQEHLEKEQRQNRRRLLGLGTVFVIILGAFLVVPVYLVRMFMEQNQQQMDIYLASQEDLSRSLRTSLRAMTRAAEQLRWELSQDRVGGAVLPPEEALAGQPVPPSSATPMPAEEPQDRMAAVLAVDAEITGAAVASNESGRIMLDQPIPADVPTNTPDFAAVPPLPEPALDESRARTEKDLEGLLQQVEAAIEAKARELEQRKAAREAGARP